MQLEPQIVSQEIAYARQHQFKLGSVCGEQNEIVGIADIRLRLERVLHELVKLVHIDVHEELRGEVAEREANAFACAVEAPHDLPEKQQHILVWYALGQYGKQSVLVYGSKELSHIALQHPDSTSVIAGDAVREPFEVVERFVSAFLLSARVRTGYECPVKKRIQDTVDGVMEETVPHGRFMDASRLGVGNTERFVCGVDIGLGGQIPMKREDIIGEPQLELLHIFAAAFAADELTPRFEEIFERDDTFVGDVEFLLFHTV